MNAQNGMVGPALQPREAAERSDRWHLLRLDELRRRASASREIAWPRRLPDCRYATGRRAGAARRRPAARFNF
jgi:hypothetical protein